MWSWIAGILPVLLGGAGYLVKRWLERQRADERLGRKLKVLSIYRSMKREGLTVTDLKRLERQLVDDGAVSALPPLPAAAGDNRSPSATRAGS